MKKQTGFTLLELLVGLAVFSLIVAGLGAGTHFALRAGETQTRVITRTGDLDAVERTLRRAFAAAAPAPAGTSALQGAPDQVSWTTSLPQAATDGRRMDAHLSMTADHRLMLRLQTHLYGRPSETPPVPRDVELLRGIDRVEISYWRGGWTGTWIQADLPALIRVRILFPSGDPRHWPDLVVATVLQTLH